VLRPRGFGFIEFRDPRDAEEALYKLDRTMFMGREISVRTVVLGAEGGKGFLVGRARGVLLHSTLQDPAAAIPRQCLKVNSSMANPAAAAALWG